jgi:F-type H+-transporting ATPase subunit delta
MTVHPNNKLTINVIEAAPLEDFSLEVRSYHSLVYSPLTSTQAVRSNLSEAQKTLAGNGSEADKAEASLEVDVYEALQHALA